MRHKNIRTPGSRNVMHRVTRKTSAPVCSACGSLLHGLRKMGAAKFAGSAASQKKVSRKFGGAMCVSCSREALRARARNI